MSFETDTFQKEPGDLLLEEGKLSAQQLEQVRRRHANVRGGSRKLALSRAYVECLPRSIMSRTTLVFLSLQRAVLADERAGCPRACDIALGSDNDPPAIL